MVERNLSARPQLILFAAPYRYAHKNAVAATLAWAAERRGFAYDAYYDAIRHGRHYGGGDPRLCDLGDLTGGLISGGRHLEAVAQALQRFNTTVICIGHVAISNTLAANADSSGATVIQIDDESVIRIYDDLFNALDVAWPRTAVMVNASPSPDLEGIDAYCYPEIFYRQAVGIEASAPVSELEALRMRGVQQILTCGVSESQQALLTSLGFEVTDLAVIEDSDDFAAATYRLARRWQDRRQGWLIGDPTLVSYWLPTACRDRRAAIYSIPQSRIIEMLREDIEGNTLPILGRQFEDADFFELSRLGQSFQLVDPGRPPLPILQTVPSEWAKPIPDPRASDPSDAQLHQWASGGRVLVSLVFWTGMIRETENLFALMDLLALTGLRAGIVLTVQSLALRPPPLELLTVPFDQGGIFPKGEILLASCGTGAAIEALLTPERLALHLQSARNELERIRLPSELWPSGWWASMDAPMIPRERGLRPMHWRHSPPYIQLRFHPRTAESGTMSVGDLPGGDAEQPGEGKAPKPRHLRRWVRETVRESRLSALFDAYRPYEGFAPGPPLPGLLATVRDAGFSYALSKSGFGQTPHIVWRDGEFVALNYTAGQWDGWTPFETINDVYDLRRAEKALLSSGQPGWLLGGIDTCLWAFSGELWQRAPGLAAIARFATSGGSSGKLINVPPRVLARYARVIADRAGG